MGATTDPVYVGAVQTLNRVTPLATFDANTTLGSAYWNLNNVLQIARGDANVGGTPVSAETRARILDVSGNLLPGAKAEIATWVSRLNSAYPVATLPSPLPAPVNPNHNEPFLGGILDGEVFGVPKKLIAVGVLAYFLLGK